MSDFIFSRRRLSNGLLMNSLSVVYGGINTGIIERNYSNGSFAFCSNIYHGFNEYETDDFICIVIGGPILNFTNNNFISKQGGNDGTKAIFQKWKIENNIKWDEDISGPFVICYFNKQNGDFEIITDMMSFIPVYINMCSENLIIGTHVNVVASIQNNSIDKISLADFVLHEVITFPYTIFDGLLQLHPATINIWRNHENKSNQFQYWKPTEPNENFVADRNLNSVRLRNGLINYLKKIIDSKAKVATFLSGGEDSRIVLSAIPQNYPKDSFIFIDELNRETSIAEKVAEQLNTHLIVSKRKPAHYWDILKPACRLIGCSGDYAHVHTYGFHDKCNFHEYDVILGGFLSDTLLKGHHVKKKRINKLLKFLPIPETVSESEFLLDIVSPIFNSIILEKLNQRRIQHLNNLSELRPRSYKEWFNIWPISMHNDAPNIFGNRRLFRSYEPFTDSEIIKVSAQSCQSFKLNKLLFHKAFKPLFLKTKWIPHSSGSYPFLPWYVNNPLVFWLAFNKRMKRIFLKESINQSSWSDWNELMKLDEGKELSNEFSSVIEKYLKSVVKNDFDYHIINNPNLTTIQKRIVIQLGYHFSQLNTN